MLVDVDIRELAIHRRISRSNYSAGMLRLRLEGSPRVGRRVFGPRYSWAEQSLKVTYKLARAGIHVKEILEDFRDKRTNALEKARELESLACLEDLSVYKVKKKGKKGKTNESGMRPGGRPIENIMHCHRNFALKSHIPLWR